MELILFHILLLLLLAMSTKSTSSQNSRYDECSKKFSCGDKDHLGYPFYEGSARADYCGYPGFKLDCIPDNPPKITIYGQVYSLTNTDDLDKFMITLSRNDTWEGECPDRLTNTTMDSSKFNFSSTSKNITFFYNCQGSNSQLSSLETTCSLGGLWSLGGYYLTQKMLDKYQSLSLFQNCKSNIFLPVSGSRAEEIDNNPHDKLGILIDAFEEGFELDLIANNEECSLCMGSDGVCGYNFDSSKWKSLFLSEGESRLCFCD